MKRQRTKWVWVLAMVAGAASACAQASDNAAALEEYVGQYQWASDPDIVTTVYLEGKRLYEEREGREPQAMISEEQPDRFRVEVPAGTHMVFERDAAGGLTGCRLVLDRDGRTLVREVRVSGEAVRSSHYRAYTRQEAMIPMRDGVRLHAVILRPARVAEDEALPFLMERTPYGVDDYDSESLNLAKPELAASGYIFVYEDIRGRYQSEGKFVMNRPLAATHAAKTDVDETTDTRDTIDWLLANEPGNNGRVGAWGVSYPGFLAMMAGIDAHPAVKAISPQAPMTDVWMGDDFFHNGAFRASYGFDYVQEMEAQKTAALADSKEDMYDFFLRHRNFQQAAEAAGMEKLPTARAFLTQPGYTKFWQDMALQGRLGKVTVPTLEVGGYWDEEDMWGTQAEYAALKQGVDKQVYLVLGPWIHGGWSGPVRRLGPLDFGEPTGTEYRKQFEAPFFEKYLKGRPGFSLTGVASFRTGENRWERYDAWPPKKGFQPESLYLEPGKAASFAAPTAEGNGEAARYVADPADPVPYRHRPIQSTYGRESKWYTWLVEDQRFVSERKDLANFETPLLDKDVTVTGEVTADLFAATTGSDADWVVKLIDVYPEDAEGGMAGYQLMVAEEIFRGRYRQSFEVPEALKPGAVTEFRWSLHGADHTFAKGHRMMVEVQSSWFPLYDRNPQTFVPNIMTAPAKAYKAETVTIYGSAKWPSRLEFGVGK